MKWANQLLLPLLATVVVLFTGIATASDLSSLRADIDDFIQQLPPCDRVPYEARTVGIALDEQVREAVRSLIETNDWGDVLQEGAVLGEWVEWPHNVTAYKKMDISGNLTSVPHLRLAYRVFVSSETQTAVIGHHYCPPQAPTCHWSHCPQSSIYTVVKDAFQTVVAPLMLADVHSDMFSGVFPCLVFAGFVVPEAGHVPGVVLMSYRARSYIDCDSFSYRPSSRSWELRFFVSGEDELKNAPYFCFDESNATLVYMGSMLTQQQAFLSTFNFETGVATQDELQHLVFPPPGCEDFWTEKDAKSFPPGYGE